MQKNIIYACDENYAPITALSAASAAKHNPGASITLLGHRLGKAAVGIVEAAVRRFGGSFRHLAVEGRLNEISSTGINSYFSYVAYARVFIADMLADLGGKALYLDSDTLVIAPLDELFATEMGDSPLALAPDVCPAAYERYIGLKSGQRYFNTGVSLVDLGNWRRKNCTKRFLKEISNPSAPNPLGDQDVTVRLFNDEIVALEPKWNYLSQYVLLSEKIEPAILHFSGNTLGRPWFAGSRHPRRGEYRALADELGLLDKVMTTKEIPFVYRLETALYSVLPGFAFRPVFRLMHRLHIRIAYGV